MATIPFDEINCSVQDRRARKTACSKPVPVTFSNTTKFIYAVQSDAFPGLIKIGRTQNVKERLSQLNTACAPSPFVIVVVCPTLDCIRDEKEAHDFFSDHRKEGEFFQITKSQVIEFFKILHKKYDSESKRMDLQAPDVSRDNAKKAQRESILKMLLDGVLRPQQTRASLAAEAGPAYNEISRPYKRKLEELEEQYKRKLEELEVTKLEVEIQAKKIAIRDSEREHIVKCYKRYKEMCQDTVMDERARLIFKDCLLNMVIQQGQNSNLLTNGEPSPNKPISISEVAKDPGLKIPDNEYISIGMKIKKST